MPTEIKPDWLSIEGEYRGTTTPTTVIAAKHGVAESTIRKRAQKYGWVRDPAGSKRALVDAALSGATGANGATDGASVAQATMQDEAAQDINDMRLSLETNRVILRKAKAMAELVEEPQPLKILAEAVRTATDTIRRIRKLDEQPVSIGVAGGGLRSVEFHVVTPQ